MIFYLMLAVYLYYAYKYKNSKVVLALLFLQVASLTAIIFINGDSFTDNPRSWINALFILFANLSVILPWAGYSKLKTISVKRPDKIERLVKVLLVISLISFVVLGVTAFLVQTLISDVNAFKYEGESVDFYYSMLPFDVRLLIIAFSLHVLSYFMLFFHFYYMWKDNKKRMILCFIASLNLILYGLCFFSRWTLTMYASMYGIMAIVFYPLLRNNYKEKLRKYAIVAGVSIGAVFTIITITRFENDERYEFRIPDNSPIKDPKLYSIFDYLGQNNSAGIEVLNNYDGTTFGGGFAIKQVKSFLQSCRVWPADNSEQVEIAFREKYFKQHEGGFIGWAAYTVYDFGYILTVVICIIYIRMVRISRDSIDLYKFLKASILIQIPICAIYYSWMPTVLMCFFFYFFMNQYLKLIK